MGYPSFNAQWIAQILAQGQILINVYVTQNYSCSIILWNKFHQSIYIFVSEISHKISYLIHNFRYIPLFLAELLQVLSTKIS